MDEAVAAYSRASVCGHTRTIHTFSAAQGHQAQKSSLYFSCHIHAHATSCTDHQFCCLIGLQCPYNPGLYRMQGDALDQVL